MRKTKRNTIHSRMRMPSPRGSAGRSCTCPVYYTAPRGTCFGLQKSGCTRIQRMCWCKPRRQEELQMKRAKSACSPRPRTDGNRHAPMPQIGSSVKPCCPADTLYWSMRHPVWQRSSAGRCSRTRQVISRAHCTVCATLNVFSTGTICAHHACVSTAWSSSLAHDMERERSEPR